MYKYLFYCIAWVGISLTAQPAGASAPDVKPGYPEKRLSAIDQRKFDYFYYEGLNLKARGKFDAAYEAFNHCLALDSTASPVLYELSTFYVQMNRPAKAVDMLKRAVGNEPANYTYKMALASLTSSLGMYGESAEVLEQLIATYPDKVELNYYLAEALTQQGEIGEAIKAYDALESAVGMNEALSIQKYKLYTQLEEKGNAFKEIEKLAAKYPMEARYQLLMGDLHLDNKELPQALACYQKAHAIDAANPYYIVSMANYYEAAGNKDAAETEIRNALVNENLDIETKVGILSRYILKLQQSNQGLDTSTALFETLIEQHPEDTDLKMMYGGLLAAQGKNDEAKFQYQLVTEMEPENPGAWQQLLNMATKAADFREVVRICTRCIELFPDSPEYYFFLGVAHYQEGNYQSTLDAYQAGLVVIPVENMDLKSDFYGQIGDTYYQMGALEKAYAAYDEALKYNERNISVLNNYAYFLSLEKKDLKKAERMSAQTVRLEPENATYLDTYAWVFFVQGEYSLAKIYIEKAISNDKTNSTELVDHYGDILFMTGNKEKAVEQWKLAKERGKESKILDRKIAEQTYIEDTEAK